MVAVPVEVFEAPPPRFTLAPMRPPVADWVRVAVLSELLPVAVLPPVEAVAVPSLVTAAACPAGCEKKGVKVELVPSVVWATPVPEAFPVAVAGPVVTSAVPEEVLDEAGPPRSTLALMRPPLVVSDEVSLVELLPVAVLPPVLAVPLPLLPMLTLISWPLAPGARARLKSARPATSAITPAIIARSVMSRLQPLNVPHSRTLPALRGRILPQIGPPKQASPRRGTPTRPTETQGTAARERGYSVTAPRSAPVTSLAYLASTPVV